MVPCSTVATVTLDKVLLIFCYVLLSIIQGHPCRPNVTVIWTVAIVEDT